MTGKRQGSGESSTSKRRLSAAMRQKMALELRIAGKTFDEIADDIGYSSRSGAYKAVEAALRKTLQEPADELRKVEMERIDRMWEKLWSIVFNVPEEARSAFYKSGRWLHVMDRLRQLMERRAKLLGLDTPIRTELTGEGGGPITLKIVYDEDDGNSNEGA